jgi:hypothetical protein
MLGPFDIFYGHLGYLMIIWDIFPVLICFTKKNLATLVVGRSRQSIKKSLPSSAPGWPDEFVKKLPKMWPNPFFAKINA